MSKSEEYLDQLLRDISNGAGNADKSDFDDVDLFSEETKKSGQKRASEEDEFLREFERDFLEADDAIDLLSETERENDKADIGSKETEGFADSLDDIVDSAKRQMQNAGTLGSMDDIEVDTMNQREENESSEEFQNGISEIFDAMQLEQGAAESNSEESGSVHSEEPEQFKLDENSAEPELLPEEDTNKSNTEMELNSELMDIFAGNSNFSDISDMFSDVGLSGESEEVSAPQEAFSQPAEESVSVSDHIEAEKKEDEEADGKKKRKKGGKKKEKAGEGENGKDSFFAKLGHMMFGEEEDEEEVSKTSGSGASDGEGDASSAPEEKKKKEKKKKEKKPKPKKEKKPKPKKPPKPKKEKKPKEPDNTPPLPKAPVFLIFVMTVSILALIIIGTNLIGYANHFSEAKNAYAKGDYTEAYRSVSGIKVKEKDMDTYGQYRVMAFVSGEYEAYQGLMEGDFYDMALDSLIRAIGRCETYREDAEKYGCIGELEKLESELEAILITTFGTSKGEALELYGYEDRVAYSREIYTILKRAGLEKAAE